MIDLEKLEADVRKWTSRCMACVYVTGGFVGGLLVAWVF